MGGNSEKDFSYIESMWLGRPGRAYIKNPRVRGGDSGIRIGGSSGAGISGISFDGSYSVDVRGGSIRADDVGVEVRENGRGVFRDMSVEGHDVADFAYHKDAEVMVINTYAERLFELTSGSFSTVDNDLNFIAQQLLTANDPEEVVNLAQKLKYHYEKVPDFMQSREVWDVVKRIVEFVYTCYKLYSVMDSATSGI